MGERGRIIRSVKDARANLADVMAALASGEPIEPETLAAARAAVERLQLPASSYDTLPCDSEPAPSADPSPAIEGEEG